MMESQEKIKVPKHNETFKRILQRKKCGLNSSYQIQWEHQGRSLIQWDSRENLRFISHELSNYDIDLSSKTIKKTVNSLRNYAETEEDMILNYEKTKNEETSKISKAKGNARKIEFEAMKEKSNSEYERKNTVNKKKSKIKKNSKIVPPSFIVLKNKEKQENNKYIFKRLHQKHKISKRTFKKLSQSQIMGNEEYKAQDFLVKIKQMNFPYQITAIKSAKRSNGGIIFEAENMDGETVQYTNEHVKKFYLKQLVAFYEKRIIWD